MIKHFYPKKSFPHFLMSKFLMRSLCPAPISERESFQDCSLPCHFQCLRKAVLEKPSFCSPPQLARQYQAPYLTSALFFPVSEPVAAVLFPHLTASHLPPYQQDMTPSLLVIRKGASAHTSPVLTPGPRGRHPPIRGHLLLSCSHPFLFHLSWALPPQRYLFPSVSFPPFLQSSSLAMPQSSLD